MSLKEEVETLRQRFLKEAQESYAKDMFAMGTLPKAGILCAGLGLEKPFVLYLLAKTGAMEKDPGRYLLPPEHGLPLLVDYAMGRAAVKLMMHHLRRGVGKMDRSELERRLTAEDYTLPEYDDHEYMEHCR